MIIFTFPQTVKQMNILPDFSVYSFVKCTWNDIVNYLIRHFNAKNASFICGIQSNLIFFSHYISTCDIIYKIKFIFKISQKNFQKYLILRFTKVSCLIFVQFWSFRQKRLLGAHICSALLISDHHFEVPRAVGRYQSVRCKYDSMHLTPPRRSRLLRLL